MEHLSIEKNVMKDFVSTIVFISYGINIFLDFYPLMLLCDIKRKYNDSKLS